jgi:phosphate starvation-inducible protein PhoH
MSRKRALKASVRNNVYQLEQALLANGRAVTEGPTKRKHWSRHDLHDIKPLTPAQREMIYDFMEGQNIVASGSAGTGKTFLAIYLALQEVLNPESECKKIILVRSAVPTRDLGFMPGTLEEKAALYEMPYKDIFHELMGRSTTYQDMKESNMVDFQTTSFIRGLTWDDAVIVVDEVQSMTFHEINTIMTRLGRNSRIILAGDLPQTDLRKKGEVSGMEMMMKVTDRMGAFTNVTFTQHDIIRSDFVKSWIIAAEEMNALAG